MAEDKSTGRPVAPTGDTVRENIRRIRDNKKISAPQLSERLKEYGRPIPPLGIHRIESGQRRVDVDDLVAFALALDVSPISLLTPCAKQTTDGVRITGIKVCVPAGQVWEWLAGNLALGGRDKFGEFIHEGWPIGRSRRVRPGVPRRSE